jgi:acyl-coenzyme A synthetase/AMP-(fatty) acid ligase
MTVPLAQVLADGSMHASAAAYGDSGVRDRGEFAAAAAAVARFVRARPESRCVLAAADAWNFAAAFFGCLAANKVVLIPPNFLPATLASMSNADAAVLDDAAIAQLAPAEPEARTIAADARIELYTSGTAGEPRRIVKHLSQLDAEVAVLEAMFGKRVGASTIVGTVPHHHIYGLLFRLLWPLASRRAFEVEACGEPHTLEATLKRHARCALVSSPAQLSRLTHLVDLPRYRSRIAEVFSSGGPLAAADAAAVGAALGEAPVEVYGSTESGGVAWRRQSASDAWTPLREVSVRLGEAAALVVRSPFASADGTELTLADAAHLLPDGRFRLLGRLDRIVKIEEKRVSLGAMEAKLREHPWVRDAAAVLLASRRNIVGAAAVLAPEGCRTLESDGRGAVVGALRAHLSQHVEAVALPRRWRFPQALPYNERGKLTRVGVAALFDLPAA